MELKDTVSQMVSDDYKERFKAEYNQLKIRRDKLETMLLDWKENKLNFILSSPIHLYKKQLTAMNDYLEALQERALDEGVVLNE